MNHLQFSCAIAAIKNGCQAATHQGITRWLRKYPNQVTPNVLFSGDGYGVVTLRPHGSDPAPGDHRKLVTIPLRDWKIGMEAEAAVSNANPRVRNWQTTIAKVDPDLHLTRLDKDAGQYSSRCTYKKIHHFVQYHSSITLYRSLKTVEIAQCKTYKLHVFAPAGLTFSHDTLGIKVVAKDGTDYHPTADEWKSRAFAKEIRAKLTEKRRKSQEIKRFYADSERAKAVKLREIVKCRVTLNDSRSAGNCVEGSLVFAEKRLGMDRREILNGGHLVSVKADRLLATGDPRACNAVERAWLRETTISI